MERRGTPRAILNGDALWAAQPGYWQGGYYNYEGGGDEFFPILGSPSFTSEEPRRGTERVERY